MSLVYKVDPDKYNKKSRGIYLGGKKDSKSKAKLESWGVTHILNVTQDKETSENGIPNYFESTGLFVYKRIPLHDAPTSDLLHYAEEIISFIHNGLYRGSVLVHCRQGVSRSATCVAFYLMKKCGKTFEESMNMMKSNREIVKPIPAFLNQLKSFENKCTELGFIKKQVMDEKTNSSKGMVLNAMIGPALPPHLQKRKERHKDSKDLIQPFVQDNSSRNENKRRLNQFDEQIELRHVKNKK